jgi:hypothetical protein
MSTTSRTPLWSDTLLVLLGAAAGFLPLAFLAFFFGGFGDLGSNGEPFGTVAPEPLLPAWVFPTVCALGVVVPMAIAIRIVVRHRAWSARNYAVFCAAAASFASTSSAHARGAIGKPMRARLSR